MTTTTTNDLADFLAALAREEVAARTVSSYAIDLAQLARWFAATQGEPFTAAALTPTDLRAYRGYLQTVQGAAPATINRRLAAVRRFCQWATATGRIADDPSRQVKSVRAVQVSPKSIDKRDVDKLLRAVERHGSKRDLAVVLVLRHCGLRVGELCALRLDDVAISERKGSVTIRSGKGARYRIVPLNVDARRAIQEYLAVRPHVASDVLFAGKRGQRLGSRGVENLIGRYARLAGLTDVTPHTLRHSFARHALDAGVDLVTVAALLGHERLETTARYTQPSARDLERAVERLETAE